MTVRLGKSVLGAIGNTPLLRLNRLPRPGSAEVWLKWEAANPSGSMKDRMARSIVEGAEKRGDLTPGIRVVEWTGGSTGGSLAMICAATGYNAHFVSSDAFSAEKLQTMRAFGAMVEIIPSPTGKATSPELIELLFARVRELAREPDTYWPDQFNNPDNPGGYHGMAAEILEQMNGQLEAFVMGVGTGGAFSGNAEILKERRSEVHCVAVEPAGSRNLSGGPIGPHRIDGIGDAVVPKILRMDLVDEIIAVSDEDAWDTVRQLARREGLLAGISSGANVFAALRIAERLGEGRRVVTVACDSGMKYLQGDLFS